MAANSSPQTKNALLAFGFILAIVASVFGLIAAIVAIDYGMTEERRRVSCVTAWDARFEPKFEGSTCSILQAGYRVPLGRYSEEPASVRTPEGRDY